MNDYDAKNLLTLLRAYRDEYFDGAKGTGADELWKRMTVAELEEDLANTTT